MPKAIQAAAFRLGLEAYVDEAAMARALILRLRPLRGDGVSLVVLPGLYGVCLLAPWLSGLPWPELVKSESRGLASAFQTVATRVAHALEMVVIPGSIPVWTGSGYREQTVVAGPDGVLGEAWASQPDAGDPLLIPADVLDPIETPAGMLGILLGADVKVPEASRILALKGADILVAPLAPEAPYTSERAIAGLWREVQQNQVFGIEAGLVGDLGGRLRSGKAALLAPCEIAADESGFLGRVGYLAREGHLTAALDFEALSRVRRDYPLRRQMNPALYRAYAHRAYSDGGGADA